jgi:hypothetical protein
MFDSRGRLISSGEGVLRYLSERGWPGLAWEIEINQLEKYKIVP